MGGSGAGAGARTGRPTRPAGGARPRGPPPPAWGRWAAGGVSGSGPRRAGAAEGAPARVSAGVMAWAGGSGGGGGGGASSGDDDMALERLLGAPRLTFGLDVHRRVHARAVGARGYGLQWKAFCERAKLDALDGTSEEAEATLANFHFQLEDGAARFEADAGEGWPQGARHPVQVSTLPPPCLRWCTPPARPAGQISPGPSHWPLP